MTVDDRTRLNLHRKLEAVLGPEEADTLMAHLPPVTWNDVATKHDLATLETSIRASISDAITTQTKWMVTVVLAWSALLLTAVSFVR
jgi:hypothetical protein